MPTTLQELQKSQFLRLYIDVLFMGPFLIYLASRKRPLSGFEKVTLGALGAGVIAYNYSRYKINQEQIS